MRRHQSKLEQHLRSIQLQSGHGLRSEWILLTFLRLLRHVWRGIWRYLLPHRQRRMHQRQRLHERGVGTRKRRPRILRVRHRDRQVDVSVHRMRRLIFFSLAPILVLAACSSVPAGDGSYLGDAAFRRSELTASLVNPSNGYAQKRLTHYDSGDANDWSLLPESNPRTAPLDPNGLPGAFATLDLSDPDLGKAAFFRYPVQEVDEQLESPSVANASGFWTDHEQGLGGLVRVTYSSGLSATAMTCSTCHAREDADGLTVGIANPNINLGWDPVARGRHDHRRHRAGCNLRYSSDEISHLPASRRQREAA